MFYLERTIRSLKTEAHPGQGIHQQNEKGEIVT
jgi:hypothetical protein